MRYTWILVLVCVGLSCVGCSSGNGTAGSAWEGVRQPVGAEAIYLDRLYRTDPEGYRRYIKEHYPQVERNARRLTGLREEEVERGGSAPVRHRDLIDQQKALNWCWAACIQGILRQADIEQSQLQIAARLDGWPRDRPAYISELVMLSQSYGLRAWQTGRIGSPQELHSTLQSGWKLIAFVRPTNRPVGHYIVLEGVAADGAIVASDPAPGTTRVYSLNDLYYRWRWSDSVVVGR